MSPLRTRKYTRAYSAWYRDFCRAAASSPPRVALARLLPPEKNQHLPGRRHACMWRRRRQQLSSPLESGADTRHMHDDGG